MFINVTVAVNAIPVNAPHGPAAPNGGQGDASGSQGKAVQAGFSAMAKGAFLATFAATIAVAYASGHLALALVPPPDPELPGLPDLGSPEASGSGADAAAPWPDAFGTPPPPKAAPAPPPPAPEKSTRYGLKGLIAGQQGGWAVLTDGAADLLVKTGDTLEDGSKVTVIDRHGVTLDLNGTLSRVGFVETASAPADTRPPDTGTAEEEADSADFASIPVSNVTLDLTGLDRRDMRRILARAGAIEQIDLADGTQALDLAWIRNGQLYDRLGLQAGDRILKINGIAAGDNEAILRASRKLLGASEYRLDILRNGQRQAIEVKLVDND